MHRRGLNRKTPKGNAVIVYVIGLLLTVGTLELNFEWSWFIFVCALAFTQLQPGLDYGDAVYLCWQTATTVASPSFSLSLSASSTPYSS